LIKNSHHTPKHGLLWSKSPQLSLGFAQTCRQLREEYLSVLREIVVVTVCDRDIEAYVSTFFPNKTRTKGTLLVDTSDSAHIPLLPLIHIRARAPNIVIKLNLASSTELALLEKVVAIYGNKKWARYALQSVASVTFIVDQRRQPTRLGIGVKLEAEERWMPWPNLWDVGQDTYFAALSWRKAVGLENAGFMMANIHISIKPDEAFEDKAEGDEQGELMV
jgi:hypothetical protein